MPDTVAPWWGQYAGGIIIALIGSGVAISEGIRKISSGFGKAEARKVVSEAVVNEATAANLASSRSADFENALNARTFKNFDMLEAQIHHLTDLVEKQTNQLTVQSEKMDHMEQEIINLRQVLDARTRELQKARSHFPPVCKSCEFFNGTNCTIDNDLCKLVSSSAVADAQQELELELPVTMIESSL